MTEDLEKGKTWRKMMKLKKWKIKNILVIAFLTLFLIYIGNATRKHIKEYNDSLVGVKVILPGTVTKKEFIVLKTVAEKDDDGSGMRATAILDASAYYGEFEWEEGDRGKIRTPDGRSIEKQSVEVKKVERGAEITFDFEDAQVKPGDEVEMVIDVRLTKVALNAVPFDILRHKNNRYYFYEVVKKNGIWGYEYVVKETAPMLKTVEYGYGFFRGYAAKAPIVIQSEAELSDGMRVKFEFDEDR